MSTSVSGAASDTLSARVRAWVYYLMDSAGRIAAKVSAGVIAADAELEDHPEFAGELRSLEALAPPGVVGAVDIAQHLLDAVSELTAHADAVTKSIAGAAPTVAGASA